MSFSALLGAVGCQTSASTSCLKSRAGGPGGGGLLPPIHWWPLSITVWLGEWDKRGMRTSLLETSSSSHSSNWPGLNPEPNFSSSWNLQCTSILDARNYFWDQIRYYFLRRKLLKISSCLSYIFYSWSFCTVGIICNEFLPRLVSHLFGQTDFSTELRKKCLKLVLQQDLKIQTIPALLNRRWNLFAHFLSHDSIDDIFGRLWTLHAYF